jgi:L-lactate dehydrogenase complex protein LldE
MTNQIDIFVPCFIDQLFPETAFNMIKILEKQGLEIHYNPNQTCCGQMAFTNGFWDEARTLGEKFLKDFPNNRYIVGGSCTCIGFIKNYYGKLFHNTAYHLEFRQLQRNIFEFTDFLVNVLRITNIGATFNHKVTYHDSCSALREYGIKDEPRLLLQQVKGLQLVEMKNTDICCGFGGGFSVKNEAISIVMAENKVNNALETGAEYIVSTDITCLMHMNSYIQKKNLPIKCIHIIDLLASGL